MDKHGLRKQWEAYGNAKPKQPLTLFILDLDQLKEINDTPGHAIGGHLQVQLAKRLEKIYRNYCIGAHEQR